MFSYVQNDVKNCVKSGKIRVFCGIQVYTKQGALLVSESADNARVSKDSADYVKVKEINVGYLSGTIRVAFDSRDPSGGSHWVHAVVYKNGVLVGTERDQDGGWFTYSEDLAFAKNDLLQLYVKNSDAGFPIEVRNFRIEGKFPIPQVPAVNVVP